MIIEYRRYLSDVRITMIGREYNLPIELLYKINGYVHRNDNWHYRFFIATRYIMSIFLSLDSSGQTLNPPNDFTISFSRPIDVSDGQYEIALVRSNLWYSWSNVSAAKGNNKIRYYSTYNIIGWRPMITLPDGQYTIADINSFLVNAMTDNGDYITSPSGVKQYPITISPNYSTLKVDIAILPSFQLDFTVSTLCILLGWTQQIVTTSGTGSTLANINDSINSLLIHCSLVASSYKNGIQGDIIWSFIPNTPPGSNIDVEVKNLIYLPIYEPAQISNIRMSITDQLNRTIDFKGEPVTYLLHIRRITASDKTYNDPFGK